MDKLEEDLNYSKDSFLLSRVREIEVQLALKLAVDPLTIPADVFAALLLVQEERNRYEKENPKT